MNWQAVKTLASGHENEREYSQTVLRTSGKVVKASHQSTLFIQIVSPKKLRRLKSFIIAISRKGY